MAGTIDENDVVAGSRWEDQDPRNRGRVLRIIYTVVSFGKLYASAVVEVHPTLPKVVGRQQTLAASTLLKRFKKLSH